MRILVAVDFSECSRLACRWAVERLASLHIEEVVFQHVADPGEVPSERLGALEKVVAEVRTFVEGSLETPLPEGIDVRFAVSRGSTAPSLIEAAESLRVGTIVMGTHGRRGLDRLLLGSVAERVVRAAPCTVVVVRPDLEPTSEA